MEELYQTELRNKKKKKKKKPRQQNDCFWQPEIGRHDVPWTLAAHHIDVLRKSVDPKMVQFLTEIFKTLSQYL